MREARMPDEVEVGKEPDTLIIEDESLAPGFVMLPRQVLRNNKLSLGARLLYGTLLDYAWQDGHCFPGQERLMNDLGVTKPTLSKFLQELRDAGLIRIKRRGLGKTNIYYLTPLSKPASQADPSQKEEIFTSGSKADLLQGEAQDPCGTGPEGAFQGGVLNTEDLDAEKNNNTEPSAAPQEHVVVKPHANQISGSPQTPAEAKTTTASDTASVVGLLTAHGVAPVVAHTLAQAHSAEEIRQQVEYLPHRTAKDPAAVLVASIAGGWSAPVACRKSQGGNGNRTSVGTSVDLDSIRDPRERRIAEIKSSLSPQEMADLRERAERGVREGMRHVWEDGPIPPGVIGMAVDKLIAHKWLGEAL